MAIPLLGLIPAVLKGLTDIGKSWMERKKVKAEGAIEIERAKIESKKILEMKRSDGQINYNVEAQRGMQASWKDEAFVLVWLGVFIGCFLPWTQPYVMDGFTFLKEHTPDWYVWALLGMVTASFGLKGWKFLKSTKGNVSDVGEND